ncbi:MAG TPA: type II toxin-antitoxin system VapC family toxin [Advenella sp.]|nr:type II toxin-antitoxin system VapC family toxin [Advenella sp.]
MIILDTNVLSELVRLPPHEAVRRWTLQQPRTALFTTTVTQAEMLYGIALLPEGQRKRQLYALVQETFNQEFKRKVLSFDETAAQAYASIAAARRRAGNPISQSDAMIAAIAQSRGAALATRNVRDFVDCGVRVVDPWKF